jgi:hypothetical protein
MPAIGIAVWVLMPLGLPAALEFSLVMAFAVIACFVSYHYAVQRTWVSRFLNGKRFDLDWPWRKPAVVTASD